MARSSMENSLECGKSMQQSLKLMADLLSGDTIHDHALECLTNQSCQAASPCPEPYTDMQQQLPSALGFFPHA